MLDNQPLQLWLLKRQQLAAVIKGDQARIHNMPGRELGDAEQL